MRRQTQRYNGGNALQCRVNRGLKRQHVRLLDVALIVEIRLPEASSSITRGQWSEPVRIHLNGQRTDDGVILLIDALSCWQADDPGANHCNPHVWIDMRQEKHLQLRLHHPQRRPACEQNNMTDYQGSFSHVFILHHSMSRPQHCVIGFRSQVIVFQKLLVTKVIK